MKSLLFITKRIDYESNKERFVMKFDQLFESKKYEKIYLIFQMDSLVNEFWCKRISFENYHDSYLQHVDYDKNFIKNNCDYLCKYLLDDFNVNDSIVLFNYKHKNEKLFSNIKKNLLNKNIDIKICNTLEEL